MVAASRSPAGRPSCSSGIAPCRRAGSAVALALAAACAGDPSGPGAGDPASISINSAATALLLGDSLPLGATVRNHAGETIAFDDVVWITSDKSVVTVDGSGMVRTVGLGAAWVVASDRLHRDSVQVTSSMRIVSVHALTDATCALTTTGAAVCWGWNQAGLLGNGTFVDSRRPILAAGDLRFDEMSAAGGIVCGLRGASMWCWGFNGSGQLADGTWTSRSTPVRFPSGFPILHMMPGAGASPCARLDNGNVWCWGWNLFNQLLDSTRVSQRQPVQLITPFPIAEVAGGGGHVCAIDTDGAAWCWGRGETGQMGNGKNDHLSGVVPVSGGLRFRQIVSGLEHSCGLTTPGDVWCWGSNVQAQLGDDDIVASNVPVRVAGLPPADTIVSTRDHTCVLSDGAPWCWGANGHEQSGPSGSAVASTPVRMAGLTLRSISAGMTHTCGIDTDGIGWCWGGNDRGSLGTGFYGGSSNTPLRIIYQP